MSSALKIARSELGYFLHSRLAIVALISLLLLATVAAVSSASFIAGETAERGGHQDEAEAAFLAQPDRHPHRMVHYGHYVYRTPPPLAVIDPGVDAYTGTSIFLEGHRQNTATFSEVRETSTLTRFGSLSPAFTLQVLVPLVLILVGYSAVTRERRSGTLRQLLSHGVEPGAILTGKMLALGVIALVSLVPVVIVAAVAAPDDAWLVSLILVAGYALYLAIWTLLVVAVSGLARSGAGALVALLAFWIGAAVFVPRVSTEVAAAAVPAPSQVETDLEVNAALRDVGDSHNAGDPNFGAFRSRILAQYEAERIEDLPVNFRGLVAVEGEERTTEVLNRFAEEKMAREIQQSAVAAQFAALSPALAMRRLSMSLAGTDLANHHRFLREAEAHRFAFVQGLNQLHAEALSYADDAARSTDEASSQRARISADNWSLLPEFDFKPAPAAERFRRALPAGGWLALWLVVGLMGTRAAAGRLSTP